MSQGGEPSPYPGQPDPSSVVAPDTGPQDPGQMPEDDAEDEDDGAASIGGAQAPPFGKSSVRVDAIRKNAGLRTTAGQVVSDFDFLASLAIAHAQDKTATAAAVKAARTKNNGVTHSG